ncbi:nitrite reductase [Desulfosporosinus sp. SYSU MS00001]|uniref:nitrite reductase n=1 Tax=Desulfosporosinus sp. SYSU MS00001 TaxID=3416284 RepID=UPI003CF72F86
MLSKMAYLRLKQNNKGFVLLLENATGFTKSSTFRAFSKMNKACSSECQCSSLCQLYITKEILSRSADSGEKVSTEIPNDILVMFKSLPIIPERYNQIDLHDAFEAVQNICDNCPSDLHSKHCVVNVVLTGLGVLVYGKEFITEKDRLIS